MSVKERVMRVQRSLHRGTIVPGVILGLVIGLAVAAFIAWTWNREPSYNERVMSDKERARAEKERAVPNEPAKDAVKDKDAKALGSNTPPVDAKSSKPAGDALSPQDRERFDFYKILPGIEEARPVTDEERRRDREKAGQSVDEVLKSERELEQEINSLKEGGGAKSKEKEAKKKKSPDDEDQLNAVIDKIQGGSPSIATKEKVSAHEAKPSSGKRVILQAGAFESEEEADRLKADLVMSGLEVRVQKHRDADGVSIYRVRLGPFSDENDVAKVRSELRRQGIKPTTIPLKEE
jgi:cell division protein FtsN